MSVEDLVLSVGSQLGRPEKDVLPYVSSLEENWYDSAEALANASAEDLTALGLPRRFAVELLAAAASGGSRGASKGKGRSKGRDDGEEYDDDRGKGKGKGKKGKGKEATKGKGEGKKGKSKARGEVESKIPVELDGIDEETLCFRAAFLGSKGSNVFHIQDSTGVTVELEGQQADGMMEVVVSGHDDESVSKAVTMCEDLVASVFESLEAGDGETGKGKGKKGEGKGKKGKSKGKGKERPPAAYEERVPVDASGLDPSVRLKGKLIGFGGQNVKHIEEAANCTVYLETGDDGGLTFVIGADDEAACGAGREMCEDLVGTVLEDASAEDGSEHTGGKDKGKGKTKGKGKSKGKGKFESKGKFEKGGFKGKSDKGAGKGKRKGKDWDEERPNKWRRTESSW